MLYTKTISPLLHQTLKDIMNIKEFNDYILAGGTGLSLHLGHRKSDDIDVFSHLYKNFEELLPIIKKYYPHSQISDIGWGARIYVKRLEDEIKVDVCSDSADFINKPIIENGIRIASKEDIAAMKLQSITTRLVKKDFWDIEELLESFSLKQMTEFFQKRYPWNEDLKDVIIRLSETDKCDKDIDPLSFKGKNWKTIKKNIKNSLDQYLDKELNKTKIVKPNKNNGLSM